MQSTLTTGPGHGSMSLPRVDYEKAPFLIIWETTQACDLACRHCRASAQPRPDPRELSSSEGRAILRQAASMGTPVFVLSGGDPLKRRDLFDLIEYGAGLGLRMATIPAATDLLTEQVVARLKESGLSQMAQSLDFPTAEKHDAFRGVPGSFNRTMQAVEWAHRHSLPVQINTTLTARSALHLEAMIELVERLGIVFWEVFFLVPVGRGSDLRGLTAAQCEAIFETLHQAQKRNDFLVKVTEAPHYRRYVAQRAWKAAGMSALRDRSQVGLPSELLRGEGPGQTIGLAPQGVNAGNGFLFISHTGLIYPSGFLPLAAGDVRRHRIEWVYRHSPLFRQLRRPEQLSGPCGRCEFGRMCGGSRARAFALTGDYLASDPWCVYRPKGFTDGESRRAAA